MSVEERSLNPWLSMWTRPRATIQSIIERDPERSVILLAAPSGISQALDKASTKDAGDTYPLGAVLMFSIMGGVISGIITLYIGGFLLKHTGRWLGGNGSGVNVRAAIAWSSVPVAWGLLIWIPELVIFGEGLFTSSAESIAANQTLYFSFLAVEFAIAIWALVLMFKSLGQVHGFSAWRALGSSVIAICVVVVPLLLIGLVIGGFR